MTITLTRKQAEAVRAMVLLAFNSLEGTGDSFAPFGEQRAASNGLERIEAALRAGGRKR